MERLPVRSWLDNDQAPTIAAIRLEPGRPKREDNDRAKKNCDGYQHLEWIVAEHSRHFSPPWS